ncbi:MAG: hypothetical protein LBL21_04465 [Rickettsiales bacterium]|nr:hypothetical protein [Rickettsiales bacterium]
MNLIKKLFCLLAMLAPVAARADSWEVSDAFGNVSSNSSDIADGRKTADGHLHGTMSTTGTSIFVTTGNSVIITGASGGSSEGSLKVFLPSNPGFGVISIAGDLLHNSDPVSDGSVKFAVRQANIRAMELNVRDILNGTGNDYSGPISTPEELNLNVLLVNARKVISVAGGRIRVYDNGDIPSFWASNPKMVVGQEFNMNNDNIYMGDGAGVNGAGLVIESHDANNHYEIDASAAVDGFRANSINAETGVLNLKVYDLFANSVMGNVNIHPGANSINISSLYGNSFVYNPWDSTDQKHYAYNDASKTGTLGSFVNPDNANLVTWHFDDASRLQLVLENTAFDPLNPEGETALFKLTAFDATGVSNNVGADGKAKLEILVDINMANALQKVRKIKLIEADYINIGNYLDLVDLYYYDSAHDINPTTDVAKGNLMIEDCGTGKKCLYAVLDFIRPLQRIVRDSPSGWNENIDQVAAAFDAFILQKFTEYNAAHAGSELDLDVNNINLVFAGTPQWMQDLFVGDRIDSDGDGIFDGDGVYSAEEAIRENSPASKTPEAALNFVKAFGPEWGTDAAHAAHVSSEIFRAALEAHLADEEHWMRRASDKTAWSNFVSGSGAGGSALGITGGFDSKIGRRTIIGGFGGVSKSDAGDFVSGFSVGLGAYGMYNMRPIGRFYASANADYHIMRASGMEMPAVGVGRAEFERLDYGFQGGLLHRVWQNYVRGRGYIGVKKIGEWNAGLKTDMGKIMEAKQKSSAVPYAGYEMSLAKDIQIDEESWLKAFAKVGAEVTMAAPNSDTMYRFVGADQWFLWTDRDPLSDGMHLRYGVGVEYERGLGIGLVASYDRIGEINIFRLGGKYRFCSGRCRMPYEIDAEMLREDGVIVGRVKSENENDYGLVPNEIRESIKHYGLPPKQDWNRRRGRGRRVQQEFD